MDAFITFCILIVKKPGELKMTLIIDWGSRKGKAIHFALEGSFAHYENAPMQYTDFLSFVKVENFTGFYIYLRNKETQQTLGVM